MVLLITNISGSDYGGYYCIAKNELAITRGSVEVHGQLIAKNELAITMEGQRGGTYGQLRIQNEP